MAIICTCVKCEKIFDMELEGGECLIDDEEQDVCGDCLEDDDDLP